ncbi:ThiF family adenylyltransferase [Siccationidurans ginsengisoli]|uniref:ThiF family adenylyltransferase n=1 Tax=Hymenobacter TaxID=89966 RepID=UPI001AAD6C7F|nr:MULTISPECIES: ThiF family adenylyltransferase [unclassified Hymenobacter]MBO2033569.1 ThiF family adenylyltransferase [Hymenobacter sp. BT559]
MLNHDEDVAFYNAFFAELPDVSLLIPFVFEQAAARYVGRVVVATAKEPVTFTVHLPEAYPQGEVLFYPQELRGYPHQNVARLPEHGGTLCLATPVVNHLHTRLTLELERLHGWLDQYYVREVADELYEYIPLEEAGGGQLLFDEEPADNSVTRFEARQSGTFQYWLLRAASDPVALPKYPAVFLGSGLGHLKARWTSDQCQGATYTGLWALLRQEPVIERKLRISRWDELVPLLPEDFFVVLRQQAISPTFRKQSSPALGRRFLLAVGYHIPGTDGPEITWDVLSIPLNILKHDKSPKELEKRLKTLDQQALDWGDSSNAAYARFFGRGQLAPALTQPRVLIVGIGAVGSTLAEQLVRGGLRRVGLADFDVVAPGNVCRSRLRFRDAMAPKGRALRQHLFALSPFVTVALHKSMPATAPGGQGWEQLVEGLRGFDLIFDCSANNQALWTLQRAATTAQQVIHLSVTEGAEELIVVAGSTSFPLEERRAALLAQLQRPIHPEFREGTGCWHSTFRATAANIDALIGVAVGELSTMGKSDEDFRSFSLHRKLGQGILVSHDHHYIQPELGLHLVVTSHCLDEIHRLTLLHQPSEFGGVLVGSYSATGKGAIVSRIIVPTKYRSSATSFTPDAGCINRQLRELPTALQYLGDWHSHPNGPAQPSPTDKRTIAQVANHAQVGIKSPLLLIVQTRAHKVQHHFFIHYQGQLYAYQNNGRF